MSIANDTNNLQAHWDKVYAEKPLESVSWYQPVPITSLELIRKYAPKPDARLIDVGGGDAYLAEHLLKDTGLKISVLDISTNALKRHQKRVGDMATRIEYVHTDILQFEPEQPYDIWHDRAAFHFLQTDEALKRYAGIAAKGIEPGGVLIIGTFAKDGPNRCSALDVHQYDAEDLATVFEARFELVDDLQVDHTTPGGGQQRFTFVVMRRKEN